MFLICLKIPHYTYVNFTDINGYEVHGYAINEEGLYCGSDRYKYETLSKFLNFSKLQVSFNNNIRLQEYYEEQWDDAIVSFKKEVRFSVYVNIFHCSIVFMNKFKYGY